jgi:hypothetical protein
MRFVGVLHRRLLLMQCSNKPHPYMRAFESREFFAGVALVGGERYRGRAGEAEVGSAGEQPAEE